MKTKTHSIDTSDKTFVDITSIVNEFCASAEGDGLVNIFVPHATAGLALMETGSGSETDLGGVLEALLPRDDRWAHAHGSRGHGADHLLPAFLSPSVTVPVDGGRPQLGTWQSIVLVDFNRDNPHRKIRLTYLGG